MIDPTVPHFQSPTVPRDWSDLPPERVGSAEPTQGSYSLKPTNIHSAPAQQREDLATEATNQFRSSQTSQGLMREMLLQQSRYEVERMERERANLLNQKFDTGLSAEEDKRYRYLNWQMDIVSYAQALPDIRRAEDLNANSKHISAEIDRLIDALRDY